MPRDTIAGINKWFAAAHGEYPHEKLTVQLGVHIEEVGEMLEAIQTTDDTANALLHNAELVLKDLSDYLKQNSSKVVVQANERSLVLDSLCDQIVTAVGIAYDMGMNIPRGLQEVSRSNYSKFVDNKPLFDENGKIKKGPDYSPPDLTGYV